MTELSYDVETLTEENLWFLPQISENLAKEKKTVKDAGFFKFNLDKTCQNRGTSLAEFIRLTKSRFPDHLKKLFIVKYPDSPNVYGHRTFNYSDVDKDEFLHKAADTMSYSSHTCCTKVLQDRGPEGLASHFFDDVIKKISKEPLGYVHKPSVKRLTKDGKLKFREHKKFMERLQSMPASARKDVVEQLIAGDKRETMEGCFCCKHESASEDDGEKRISAEYYGHGIMYASGIPVTKTDRFMMTESFGLYALSYVSMLRVLKHHYEGVTSPYLYLAGTHSFFACHIEDMALYSVNFNHHGAPRLWVIVPPTAVAMLDHCLSRTSGSQWQIDCRSLLGHKFHLPTLTWLEKHNIPFTLVVQNEGEGIVLFPNAAQFGMSTGFSIAESVNFGAQTWLPYGVTSHKCMCSDPLHIDMEEIVSVFQSELIRVYRQRRIPKVPDDANFTKSIFLNVALDPFFKTNSDLNIDEEDSIDSDHTNNESELEMEPRKKARKMLLCPNRGCGKTYNSGHKERLLRHIRKFHEDDPSINIAINEMFPERGNKIPKRQCNVCKKLIAGRASQMKSHQNSKECKSRMQKI